MGGREGKPRAAVDKKMDIPDHADPILDVTGTRAGNERFQYAAAELVCNAKNGNQEKGGRPPFRSTLDHQPQPDADKHDSHRQELIIVRHERPKIIAPAGCQTAVNADKKPSVDG